MEHKNIYICIKMNKFTAAKIDILPAKYKGFMKIHTCIKKRYFL